MNPETDNRNAATAISAALTERGVTKQQDQAAIVGEPPPVWNRMLSGKRGPSLGKVFDWIDRAAAAGHKFKIRLDLEKGVVVGRR